MEFSVANTFVDESEIYSYMRGGSTRTPARHAQIKTMALLISISQALNKSLNLALVPLSYPLYVKLS